MKYLFTIIILLIPVMLRSKTQEYSSTHWYSFLTREQRILIALQDRTPRMQQIILAQAKHESGNFSNSLTIYHNNLFAMRHPRRRPTTSIGPYGKAEGRTGYASFKSIESSVKDYQLYTQYVKAPVDTTLSAYVTFLHDKRYFECPLHSKGTGLCSRDVYFRAIDKWIERDKHLFNAVQTL